MGSLVLASVVIFLCSMFGRSKPQVRDMIGVTFTATCLVVLLVRFEEVDDIQKLKRKLQKLETEKVAAEDRKREMTDFWERMQRLTDVWLHRTVPRLELTKEIQGYLTDCKEQEIVQQLENVDKALDELNRTLGRLELWCSDGALDEKTKKWFGDQMIQVCKQQDLKKMIGSLKSVKDQTQTRVRQSITASGS